MTTQKGPITKQECKRRPEPKSPGVMNGSANKRPREMGNGPGEPMPLQLPLGISFLFYMTNNIFYSYITTRMS